MTTEIERKEEIIKKLKLLKDTAELKKELLLRERLMKIFQEAFVFKQEISKNWDSYISFIRGNQWPKRRPSHKVSAMLNFMIENIERKNALLTDAKPIPKVKPRADKFQDTANIINDLIKIIFNDGEFGQNVGDLVNNSQVLGSSFMGTLYDKSADFGRGDIIVPSFDPRACYFDPMVKKSYLLHEGEYFIVEDVWSLEKAKDMFPERADMIKPDVGLGRFNQNQQSEGLLNKVRNVLRTQRNNTTTTAIPRTYVRDFYLKDRSKTNDKYNFKNQCRKSTMIGDIIVDDGDNPYNDGLIPFDMLSWHYDFDSAWGWGDVELLKNPQELHNKILATIIENTMLMSNAIWVGDSDALSKEDWKKLNNAPGSYVKKRPGRELRRESGMAVPQQSLEMLQYTEASSEKLSGMVDVMRGIRTGQVSSGVGIESLQLMAQALIRLRARSIEAMQARMGRKLISRIFQFYAPEKIFELLKMNNSDLTSDAEKVKDISSELLKPISKRADDAWTELIFEIEPGSSLGLAQTQKRIESMRLRELQVIDDEALLEDLEYPDRTKVIKRVEKKRQDAANAEIEAQGGKSGQFPNQKGASPSGRS